MNTILSIMTAIVFVLFICLFIWSINLDDREKRLKELYLRNQLVAQIKPFKAYHATYTITPSDSKYSEKKLRTVAKQRMLEYLARQIAKDIDPTIISEGGVEIEYRYDIEVRREENK